MPAQALPRSLASPGLLAHVATAKYADALPLYRQHQQLKRLGVDLSRTTLATWMVRAGALVVPLVNLLREELLERPYLLMDETTVQVLKEPGKGAQSKSQLWAQMSAGPEPPIVLFDYDPTRAGDVPKRLLAGFTGALHTDGYSGYGPVVREQGLVHLACWAHARRGFTDTLKSLGLNPSKLPPAPPAKSLPPPPSGGAPCPERAAPHPHPLRHRTPHPQHPSRPAPPHPAGRERPGAQRPTRLARRHPAQGAALRPPGQGHALPRQPMERAGALL